MAVLTALTLAALTAAFVVGAAVHFVWQLLLGIAAAADDGTD